jgi:D-apionolactonase
MQTKSVLELRAGPLTMIFDPPNAFIRHIRWGGQELVRAIYGAVRDHNWATIPSAISDLKTEVGNDSFRISFDVFCREREVDYFWRGTIRGESTGKVTYVFDGEARSNFRRNRIGLCVLHPMEDCAGRACAIEHVDGSREIGAFPKDISPEQPFFDIRSIEYGQVQIRCEGETFEMEDQRNWGDASFKTYSTPQRLPKPAPVSAGQKVRHEVTVTLSEQPRIVVADRPEFRFPRIGRRIDLDLGSSDFMKRLEEGAKTRVPLHVAFTYSSARELKKLADAVKRIKPKVAVWLVYHKNEIYTSAKSLLAAKKALGSKAEFASGTREWFVDLNTQRPPKDYPGMLVYAATPHIHQPDYVTMIENIAGLAYAPESAKAFSGKPVVVSPITLSAPNLPWAVALISRLAQTGNVHSLTFEQEIDLGLGDFKPAHVLASRSSHPLLTEALAMVDARGKRCALVANFADRMLTVTVNDKEHTLSPKSVSRID